MRRNDRKYIPLQIKLLVSYLALVLIPIILIGSYTYYFTMQSTEERTKGNLAMALSQYSTQVQYRVTDIIRSSDAIFDDQVLSRYLSGYYLDGERHRVMTQYVLPRMESAILLPNTQVMMSLYLDKPTIGEYYYEEKEDYLREGNRVYGIMYTDRIEHLDWYKGLIFNDEKGIWKQVGVDQSYDNISLLRPMIDYETFSNIGLLKVTVKMRDIFEGFDLSSLGEGAKLVVTDESNQFLYAPDMTAEQFHPTLLTDNSEYLMMTEQVTHMPIQMIALVPKASLKQESLKVRNITILICAISLLIAAVVSYLISKFIMKRFGKLVSSLQAFSDGEYHKRIEYQGNDEFRQISNAFNEMASTIQTQINEIYISKLAKKEAELQILHAQINPHFLYNTFSSISRMAKLGETQNLTEMIFNLAKFYRLTLNKGEMVIPLAKEIEIVEAYLDIQNIKYGDRIDVALTVDESLLEQQTVKFIIQPFVENVLEHAWYDDHIRIEISIVKERSKMVIVVADNGLGMDGEIVEKILQEDGQGIGYGIRNVNQRIQLHYGSMYGVRIESKIGEGTKIRMELPYTH